MKSSIRALTEGLTPLVSAEISDFAPSDSCGSAWGGATETAGVEPGKSRWSLARNPLLCLGLDELSWLE